jgi:hypothetical protein
MASPPTARPRVQPKGAPASADQVSSKRIGEEWSIRRVAASELRS